MDMDMRMDDGTATAMNTSMEIDSDMDIHTNGDGMQGRRTVNVLVSDVPGCTGTVLLQCGSVDSGVTAGCVAETLSKSILSAFPNVNINMEYLSYRLRCDGRILTDASQVVAAPGCRDAYVSVLVSRALPGGKGGFGANLRGAANANAKRSDNIGACRDLSGRRLRDVELAKAQRDFHNAIRKRPRSPDAATTPPEKKRKANNNAEKEENVNNYPVSAVNEGDASAVEAEELDIDVVEERMREREDEIEDDIMVGRRSARKRRKMKKKKSTLNDDSSNIKTTPKMTTVSSS